MTDMKDPVRLSLGGSPEVQQLLQSAHADSPTQRQLDHLAARLAPVVTAAPAASMLPWIIAGVVVLGAAGALLLGRDRHDEAPAHAIAQEPTIVAIEPAPTPAPVVTAPRPEPAPVIAAPPEARPTRAQPKKRSAVPLAESPQSEQVAAAEARPREMDLLGPAHEALGKRDPSRALELATRHAVLYPAGTMVEEREAIAIEALMRLGRDEGRARFDEFVVRFPRSSYRPRLERLVGESTR